MRNMLYNARAAVAQAATTFLRKWWLPASLALSCVLSRQLWLPPVMSAIEWAAHHLPHISACVRICSCMILVTFTVYLCSVIVRSCMNCVTVVMVNCSSDALQSIRGSL